MHDVKILFAPTTSIGACDQNMKTVHNGMISTLNGLSRYQHESPEVNTSSHLCWKLVLNVESYMNYLKGSFLWCVT